MSDVTRPFFAVIFGMSLILSSAAPAFAAVALPPRLPAANISHVLAPLTGLNPFGQVQKLQQLAASDPIARNVAAAMVKPELLLSGREQLLSEVGAEQLDALTSLAVNLHLDARAMSGLDSLADIISPEGRVETLNFGKWFDGPAAAVPSAMNPKLIAARVWPASAVEAHTRRVHSIDVQNGRIFINGRRPAEFLDKKATEGVVQETFVHPNDPGLLVRIYRSPGSMDAFARQQAKIDRLTPLAEAGAAPRLIEHGEAPTQAGLVHFYVQELIEGLKLRDSTHSGALEAAIDLFKRLAKAGLKLAPDAGWLSSHVLIEETAGGGARAYLVGGSAEETVDKLAAFEQKGDGKTLVVAPVRGKSLEAIIQRHRLEARAGTATFMNALRFDDEQAAASAAQQLLLDPEIAQIQVHPRIKQSIERRGAKALYGLLKSMPESAERNLLISRIPDSAYAKTEGADIASILSLVEIEKADSLFLRIPAEAWRRMSRADAERLISTLKDKDVVDPIVFNAILGGWIKEHHPDADRTAAWEDLKELLKRLPIDQQSYRAAEFWDLVSATAGGREIREILNRLPESEYRDNLIDKIPGSTYARLESAEIASILALAKSVPTVTGDWPMSSVEKSAITKSPESLYQHVPVEAWRGMSRQDALRLLKQRSALKNKEAARLIALYWLKAHHEAYSAETLRDLQEMLKLVPQKHHEPIIMLVWPMIVAGAVGKDIEETLRLLADYRRGRLIDEIPATIYARLESVDIASILALTPPVPQAYAGENGTVSAPENLYKRVPLDAWRKMSRADAERLMETMRPKNKMAAHIIASHWVLAHYPSYSSDASRTVKEMMKLVPKSQRHYFMALLWPLIRAGAPGVEIHEHLQLLEASDYRDSRIDEIPGTAYEKMESAEVFSILALATAFPTRPLYSKIPIEAWRKLSRADALRLIKQRSTLKNRESAHLIATYWIQAHSWEAWHAQGR